MTSGGPPAQAAAFPLRLATLPERPIAGSQRTVGPMSRRPTAASSSQHRQRGLACLSIRRVAGPSDDEIEAMTIGGAVVHDATIQLAEYDPLWPVLFSREAARIRAALGKVAIKVEHVGSTSVPGLAAKPVIDIVLTVPDSSDEAAFVPALEAAGYVLRIREPAWFEHRLFKGPDTNVQVHVFTDGSPEVERMERFRDHLRVDQKDRELYERTKRELATQRWHYVQHYANAKSDVVGEILARAERKASQPG